MNAFGAYAIVAGISAFASLLIAFGTITTLSQITDSGMWAIAVMTMVPAGMAVAVSFFIHQSHRASETRRDRERRPTPDDLHDAGSFTSIER